MKRYNILIFILLLARFVISQNTFFEWYATDKYEYIYNAIEVENENYILSGYVANNINSKGNAYLLKLNKYGNKINETHTYQVDSSSVNTNLFQFSGEPEILYSTTSSSFVRNDKTLYGQSFVKFSLSNLQKLEQHIYFLGENFTTPPQAILNTESNIYLLSDYYLTNPYFLNSGLIITKYNNMFDSITSYHEMVYQLHAFGIWHDTITACIKTFSVVPGIQTSVHNFTENLELTGVSELSPFLTSVSTTHLNSDQYLLTGTGYTTYGLDWMRDIYVKKYDKNDQITDSIYYHNDPDTVLYAGAVCNTAIVGDKIFVTGVYNIDPAQWPYQQEPSWIQVTRLDTALNILDHHFYGGDAYYHPYKIIATTDGGALIVGNRYDYTISEKLYHAFALKVNSDGLITDLPDHPEAKAHDAIVYPNPGRDNLTIQSGPQINEALFTLYDMQGRAMISEKITAIQLRLNTSNLPSGIYTWQIVFKNKVIESGKWVKE